MPTTLLESQLATLEGADDDREWLAAVREPGLTPQEVVGKVLGHLMVAGGGGSESETGQVVKAAAGHRDS
jgi:hypothetical protein